MSLKLSSFYFKPLEKSDKFEFDCSDEDLNDFFHNDALLNKQKLLGVTYVFYCNKSNKVVCFFTVSNDSLKVSGSFRRRQAKNKRFPFYPAVKIGRLGVNKEYQSNGIGSQLIDFIKLLFTYENKTGCRFLIVDAYNKPKVLKFYKKTDFSEIPGINNNQETKLFMFDLISYRNALDDKLKNEKPYKPSFSNR
ncbi:GNAT family N-acetyltransferase [Candidatus Margulisiibacteriota bacterium]